MEKHRILGDVDGRRPGDVTVPIWRGNRGLAIDVAVTLPFRSNLSHAKPCEHYAESKKHSYYDKDFKGTAFEFAAMVFETTEAHRYCHLEISGAHHSINPVMSGTAEIQAPACAHFSRSRR